MRTLAETIGTRLGCGAYLVGLRRTQSAGFHVRDAIPLERLKAMAIEEARRVLLPPQALVADLGRCHLDDAAADSFLHGRAVDAAGPEGELAVFRVRGDFLGVGRRDGRGRLFAVRLMSPGQSADGPDFA